ncbi:hypothetical protein ACH4NF_35590 [Streptomyces sp. NPDC017248]|uniref:hypothetical protein n=1 Tax=unclassified Streptomyces TaxID=2593676 RepID=UPI003795C3C4
MSSASGIQAPIQVPEGESQAGLFLVQVLGPESEEEFIEGFANTIRPALAEQEIATTAAHNAESYYIYGDNRWDPSSIIEAALYLLHWKAEKASFLRPLQVGPPSGYTDVCDMPYNKHELEPGEKRQKCGNGHVIAVKHSVTLCPRCGLDLR